MHITVAGLTLGQPRNLVRRARFAIYCSTPGYGSVEPSMIRASVVLVVAALLAAMMGCDPALDPGIRDWYDLNAIRGDLDGHYVLVNDLDASSPGYRELAGSTANQGKGWQPIGTSEQRFTGSLDGQDYQIRDLSVNRPDEGFVGLFGAVGQGAIVWNVGVADAAVTGEWTVGALAGGNWGQISNCHSAGSVSGDDCVGGLVGGNAGSISGCYSAAAVAGVWDVGGLVGCSDPRGVVSQSYSAGSITGQWAVGGLVGGNLGGTVSRAYAASAVTGDDYVGGLVGDNQGAVSNCYATGSVSGQWYVGGLAGYNDAGGSVSNCYATGAVSGELSVGGLVGGSDGGVVTSSFWDTQASGVDDSDGGTGKATTALRSIVTFTDTATPGLAQAWDMTAVAPGQSDPAHTWNMVDGQAYPFLGWQSI